MRQALMRFLCTSLYILAGCVECKVKAIPDPFAHEEVVESIEGVPEDHSYHITVISHASWDKIYFLLELVRRFEGNIIVGVAAPSNKRASMQTFVESMGYEERVHVLYHETTEGAPYPVNTLRNLAIEAVVTSHYLMVDLDLLPSTTLMSQFEYGLSFELKSDPKIALVVPAFEIKKYDCKNNFDCFEEVRKTLPENKIQLKQCLAKGRCDTFYSRNAEVTHSSTDYEHWFREEKDVYEIPCFRHVRYEPYVILKKTPETPRFNDKFTGYGKNKIQHINHLRFAGYRFYVMPMAFIIHMPHALSRSKHEWKSRLTGQKQTMDKLFKSFKKWLENTYGSEKRVHLCDLISPPGSPYQIAQPVGQP